MTHIREIRPHAREAKFVLDATLAENIRLWARQHLEADPDWVASELSAALSTQLELTLPPPIACSTHRWRYARSGVEGSGAVWDAESRLGLCGDWFIGARVEAAWMSGTMLAQQIATSTGFDAV